MDDVPFEMIMTKKDLRSKCNSRRSDLNTPAERFYVIQKCKIYLTFWRGHDIIKVSKNGKFIFSGGANVKVPFTLASGRI